MSKETTSLVSAEARELTKPTLPRISDTPQHAALAAVVQFVADAFNDYEAYAAGAKSPVSGMVAFGNLVPDVVSVIANVGSLPAELKELDTTAIEALVEDLAARLNLSTPHAQQVLAASVKLVNEIIGDVDAALALYRAIKNPD